jgi:hypothetical protein
MYSLSIIIKIPSSFNFFLSKFPFLPILILHFCFWPVHNGKGVIVIANSAGGGKGGNYNRNK